MQVGLASASCCGFAQHMPSPQVGVGIQYSGSTRKLENCQVGVFLQRQARTLVATQPVTAWERLSCGGGSKGPRLRDWLRIPVNHPYDEHWQRWLVARRGLTKPEDPRSTAYFLVFAPADTTLATLAAVIGERWGIERAFEESKGTVGLDQYEVRSWHGWYRHVTLALWAHAFLAVTRAAPLPLAPTPDGGPHPAAWALLVLGVSEVRRLLWAVLRPPVPTLVFLWAWSRWRRHHQALAKYYHYKRHGVLLAA